MNYHIPKKEIENFISVFWQLLQEVEGKAKDAGSRNLVEGSYRLLKRCGIHDGKPRWFKKQICFDCEKEFDLKNVIRGPRVALCIPCYRKRVRSCPDTL